MDNMDKAAVVAEQEFKAMSQHTTVPISEEKLSNRLAFLFGLRFITGGSVFLLLLLLCTLGEEEYRM